MVLSAVFWWLQYAEIFTLPFMNRVGVVFLASLAAAAIVSYLVPQKVTALPISFEGVSYKTSWSFNLAAVGVIAFLVAVYSYWW